MRGHVCCGKLDSVPEGEWYCSRFCKPVPQPDPQKPKVRKSPFKIPPDLEELFDAEGNCSEKYWELKDAGKLGF